MASAPPPQRYAPVGVQYVCGDWGRCVPPAPVCKLCDLNQSLLGGRGEQMCPSGLHPLTITSECESGGGFVSIAWFADRVWGGLQFYSMFCGTTWRFLKYLLVYVLGLYLFWFSLPPTLFSIFILLPKIKFSILYGFFSSFPCYLLASCIENVNIFWDHELSRCFTIFLYVFTCLHYPSSQVARTFVPWLMFCVACFTDSVGRVKLLTVYAMCAECCVHK